MACSSEGQGLPSRSRSGPGMASRRWIGRTGAEGLIDVSSHLEHPNVKDFPLTLRNSRRYYSQSHIGARGRRVPYPRGSTVRE